MTNISPEQVAQLITQNIGMLRNYVREAHNAGYPVEVVCRELLNKVQGMQLRPDLMTALVYDGGYKASEIAQFYMQNQLVTSAQNMLIILQMAGVPQDSINFVMKNLGGDYALKAGQFVLGLAGQTVFPIVARVEEIFHINGLVSIGVDGAVVAATEVGKAVEEAAKKVVEIGEAIGNFFAKIHI